MKKIKFFLLKNKIILPLITIFIIVLISGFYLWKTKENNQDKLIEYRLDNGKVRFMFVSKPDIVKNTVPLKIYKGEKTGEEAKIIRYSGNFNKKMMWVIFQKSENSNNFFSNFKPGEYESWFKEEVDLRKSALKSFKLLQFEANEKTTHPYALVEYASNEGNIVIITKKKYIIDPINGVLYEIQVNIPEKYRDSAEYINIMYKIIGSLVVNE